MPPGVVLCLSMCYCALHDHTAVPHVLRMAIVVLYLFIFGLEVKPAFCLHRLLALPAMTMRAAASGEDIICVQRNPCANDVAPRPS